MKYASVAKSYEQLALLNHKKRHRRIAADAFLELHCSIVDWRQWPVPDHK